MSSDVTIDVVSKRSKALRDVKIKQHDNMDTDYKIKSEVDIMEYQDVAKALVSDIIHLDEAELQQEFDKQLRLREIAHTLLDEMVFDIVDKRRLKVDVENLKRPKVVNEIIFPNKSDTSMSEMTHRNRITVGIGSMVVHVPTKSASLGHVSQVPICHVETTEAVTTRQKLDAMVAPTKSTSAGYVSEMAVCHEAATEVALAHQIHEIHGAIGKASEECQNSKSIVSKKGFGQKCKKFCRFLMCCIRPQKNE